MNKKTFFIGFLLAMQAAPIQVIAEEAESAEVQQPESYAEHLQILDAEKQGTIVANDSVAGLGTDITITDLRNVPTLISIVPPYGAEIVAESDPTDGVIELHVPGVEMQEAGIYQVYLEQDGNQLEAFAEFEVLPESLDIVNSSIQLQRDSIEPNGSDTVEVRVILRDRYGNAMQYRPVRLVSSRAGDFIQEITRETDETGEQLFSVSTSESGPIVLRAVDLLSGRVLSSNVQLAAGSVSGSMGGYPVQYQTYPAQQGQVPMYNMPMQQVPVQQYYAQPAVQASNLLGSISGRRLYGQAGTSFGIIDHFVLETPARMEANVYENITITALDTNGQVVEDYTGTINLATTDPEAVLPSFGQIQFRPSDLGQKTLVLGLRFTTPGEQLLYAEDSQNASVSGQATIMVEGGSQNTASEQTIKITSPEQDMLFGNDTVVVKGTGPPLLNIIVEGGVVEVLGETDENGVIRGEDREEGIQVQLDPESTSHTLRIHDESEKNTSPELRVYNDITPPEITKLEFDPLNPKEGGTVTANITAEDENSVIEAIMHLRGESYAMESNGTDELADLYTITFDVLESGEYTPEFTITDLVGNTAEITGSIEVKKKDLARVEGLLAVAIPNAAELEWEALLSEGPIDSYIVYVGNKPTEFDFTLDTEKDVTSATVAGLTPGETYFFAVTAMQGDQESRQKSEVVSVTIPGLSIDVTPGNSHLQLQWNSLQNTLPLSNYLLEYGVDPDNLTEIRRINGDLSQYAIRDLLNGITYYVRLTPITTTGDLLEDLAAVADGTPESSLAGFQPGPGDPIPFGLNFPAPLQNSDPPLHSGAPPPPVQPTTGIPFSKWWFLIPALLASGLWVRRRKQSVRSTSVFMHTMNEQYQQKGSETRFL